MRGKEIKEDLDSKTIRITPAYAGKSKMEQNLMDSQQDHPRVCGEKSDASMKKTAAEGSPPRMRGKVTIQPSEVNH